jgi:hypothetical protein
VFGGENVLQMTEIPIETIITMQNLPGNKAQRIVISRTSKMIQLPGVSVVRKARYGPMCVLGGIFFPPSD